MRRLFCAFLAFVFCTAALSAECPIGTTPAQYIQLEYLESTGTQWIDTGYKVSSETISAELDFIKTNNKNAVVLFGSQDAESQSSTSHYCLIYYYTNYSGLIPLTGYSIPMNGGATLNDGKKYHLTYDVANQRHKLTLNRDVVIEQSYTSTPIGIHNVYLFTSPLNSSGYCTPMKVYSFSFKDNNLLVRDFVPAMRLGDGKPGMYDKVSGRFFTNAGTGEFVMGPEVQTEFMNFNECVPCPPNTYKDFVGNSECTPCPDALVSPSGSKSVSECGRVLHIGDKIYHMKSVKHTSPALHIRDENGNVWYGNLYSEQE